MRRHLVLVAGILVAGILVLGVLLVRERHKEPKFQRQSRVVSGSTPKFLHPSLPTWHPGEPEEPDLVLTGRVVGSDGLGVGGADVWLRAEPERSAKTAEDGRFSFARLPAREYMVTATMGEQFGGPRRYRLTSTSEPVVIKLRPAGIVVVAVVDETSQPIPRARVTTKLEDGPPTTSTTAADGTVRFATIPAGLVQVNVSAVGYGPRAAEVAMGSPGPVRLTLELRAGHSVSGRVTDETGEPVAGTRVTVRDGHATEVAEAMSDARGNFLVSALSDGSYALLATDGEHAPARPVPVKVHGAEVRDLQIVVRSGGSIHGVVMTARGAPVPFAGVQAIAADEDGHPVVRAATCDRAGRFVLGGLVRGTHQLRAESEAASGGIASVDLSRSAVARDVRLVLDVEGRISGTVVNERGLLVAGADVTALPVASPGTGLARLTIATTNEDGTFSFTGLPDGEYRLGAVPHFGASGDLPRRPLTAATGQFGVRIVLPTPGTVTGRVVLAGSGAYPRAFSVQLGDPTFGAPTWGSEGAFACADVAPGSYRVLIRSNEFADVVLQGVRVEPGETVDVGTVTAPPGRQVIGRVLDSAGLPVPDARIKLVVQAADKLGGDFAALPGLRSTSTDETGAFAIGGVPENVGEPLNALVAFAWHPDHGTSNPVRISGARAEVTLVLPGR